jgi:hypothetical protein
LKVAKEEHQDTYKCKPNRITADFSTEISKARSVCKWQLRFLYLAKLSFISEGEIKTLHVKKKD